VATAPQKPEAIAARAEETIDETPEPPPGTSIEPATARTPRWTWLGAAALVGAAIAGTAVALTSAGQDDAAGGSGHGARAEEPIHREGAATHAAGAAATGPERAAREDERGAGDPTLAPTEGREPAAKDGKTTALGGSPAATPSVPPSGSSTASRRALPARAPAPAPPAPAPPRAAPREVTESPRPSAAVRPNPAATGRDVGY
jgi:hypothetical protein